MLDLLEGNYHLPCTVVVGGFFGDEGKGKIVSYLALKDRPHIAARGGVGTNAGHTVIYQNKLFKMRMLPSAFVNKKTRLLIGPGVLINPSILLEEVKMTASEDRVGLDFQCAIIDNQHILRDRVNEHLSKTVQTTGSGCGPCMEDRVKRVVKIARDTPELAKYLTDVPLEVNTAIDEGKLVLVEGTQGTFLSLYHGTYPYVTCKDVTAPSICADVGIGPTKIDDVIVVFKAYTTRVGGGFLAGELPEDEANRRGWSEMATVTQRRRRAAPFNFDLAKRAVMLNGATQAAITKLDVIYPECRGITSVDKLPKSGLEFVKKIEESIRIPVTLIGTGPTVADIIDLRNPSR